jgi:hypothetical protein
MTADPDLFRTQALSNKRAEALGSVGLRPPHSGWVFSAISFVVLLAIIGVVFGVHYTQYLALEGIVIDNVSVIKVAFPLPPKTPKLSQIRRRLIRLETVSPDHTFAAKVKHISINMVDHNKQILRTGSAVPQERQRRMVISFSELTPVDGNVKKQDTVRLHTRVIARIAIARHPVSYWFFKPRSGIKSGR